MPAAAIVGSVALGAYGASRQADAAGDASNAQLQASREATQLQREQYYDTRAIMAPQVQAGAEARARQMLMQGMSPEEVRTYLQSTTGALGGGGGSTSAQATDDQLRSRYSSLYDHWAGGDLAGGVRYDNFRDYLASGNYDLRVPRGADGQAPANPNANNLDWVDNWSYQANSPGYAFRRDQGNQAVERSQAARGQLFSGATGMALQRYGQGLASQEFEADFNRFGALSGAGSNAAGVVVNAGQNYANNAGQNIMAGGAARASGYLGAGNAWGGFFGNTVPGAVGAYGSSQGWWG